MFTSAFRNVPNGFENRAIWLLEEIQAPLLYVTGIALTVGLLISLQVMPRVLGRNSQVPDDSSEEEDDLPKQESLRTLSTEDKDNKHKVRSVGTRSYILLVFIVMLAIIGPLVKWLDGQTWPERLLILLAYLVLIALGVSYLRDFLLRTRAYMRVRMKLSLDEEIVVRMIDSVFFGFFVFAAWILYERVFLFLEYRSPHLALLILTMPAALIIGFLPSVAFLAKRLTLTQPKKDNS